MKPYCFVLMPFGEKRDENGATVAFDSVYQQMIAPAVEAADLTAIRADHETFGGVIHKAMFERLMLCDFAVADLTTANPNVFYELGVRHAVRPHSTVMLFAEGARLPFDVAHLRCMPYKLDRSGKPKNVKATVEALRETLVMARHLVDDSPFFHYVREHVRDWPQIDVSQLKTDTFRDVVEHSERLRAQIRHARRRGVAAVKDVVDKLNVAETEPGIVIDIFHSYRDLRAYQDMIDLVPKMAPSTAAMISVQEQLGLALNRQGRREEAERLLLDVIERHGPSSETSGILGRVYKDQWNEAVAAGQRRRASGLLRRAIEAYLAGFQADWRDAYPGVNAVTLMEMADLVDPRQAELLPVVRYAVQRKIATNKADYWDHATLLELAVLARQPEAAESALQDMLGADPTANQLDSTAGNLALLRAVRTQRGEDGTWIADIEGELRAAIKG